MAFLCLRRATQLLWRLNTITTEDGCETASQERGFPSAAGIVTKVRGDKGAFAELQASLRGTPCQANVGQTKCKGKAQRVQFKENLEKFVELHGTKESSEGHAGSRCNTLPVNNVAPCAAPRLFSSSFGGSL